ncbi:hypothetical protein AB0G05_40340 [Nonomuraea wenchangensis]
MIKHDYRRMSERLSAYGFRPSTPASLPWPSASTFVKSPTPDRWDYRVVASRHLPKGQRLTILPGN